MRVVLKLPSLSAWRQFAGYVTGRGDPNETQQCLCVRGEQSQGVIRVRKVKGLEHLCRYQKEGRCIRRAPDTCMRIPLNPAASNVKFAVSGNQLKMTRNAKRNI